MLNKLPNSLALFVLLCCLACSGGEALAADPFASKILPPPRDELLALLQGGGNVIYFRHAATPNRADVDKTNLDNCATQRNLSDEGRAQARGIGEAFRRLSIPVGDVLASPYCRTVDTARLAFGRAEKNMDLFSLGQPEHPDDKARAELLRKRLGTVPPSGENTILVSHGSPLDSVAQEFLREGEAAIAQPAQDGTFRVVARIRAEEWGEWWPAH